MSDLFRSRYPVAGLATVLVLALAGCGGGGGGGGLSSSNGSLTVAVTDAPVDEANEVWIEFTNVDVHGADGTTRRFTLSPAKRIDLLSLAGGDVPPVKLLDDQVLPSGDYNWIRLYVNEANSSLVNSTGTHCLEIPSNANTGLKLNRSFTLTAEGVANFVIDFDLRKSVRKPSSSTCYKLRPTLRIVDASTSGKVGGSVDPALYAESPCAENFAAGDFGAVYVYAGAGVTPDDVGGSGAQPVASAMVVATTVDSTTTYTYSVPYLDAGPYTVAFACDAVSDDPDLDDDIGFFGAANVTVSDNTTITHDFVPVVF